VPRALTRGAISPDPTPGASWLPDPLPARLIAAATASAVAVSTGSRSAGKTASGRVTTIVAAGGGARPTLPAPAPPPTAPSANTAGGYSLSRQLGLGVSRVVIDPGHGGHDPGARVKGLNEADLVLDVALRLEKLLKAQRGVEVVLTRRSNAYIPLEERTALANRESADLFLSIHANASENPKARGLETYYLNFAPNPEAERIAARENAGSARTMHALPDIVKAIALNNKIDESRDFAGQVQASMVDRLKRSNTNTRDLGVKQAPFMVLIGATMPSVLAEISFITNDDESRLLKTTDYRQHIAEALLQGIQRYQRGLKSSERLAAQ
jgi:N-acetylmuramoyl-L-alanine amidase